MGFLLLNKNLIDIESIEEKGISVLIPARGESENILNCLESLIHQNYYSQKFELIIINDHSSDNTAELAKEFINKYTDTRVRLLELKDKESKKEALKLGVTESKFELIATIDSDSIAPKNWLKNINYQFNEKVDLLIGPIVFSERDGFLSKFQMLDFLALQGVGLGMSYFNLPLLNNAANMTYKKSSYQLVNGYDDYNTPSGDDIFLLEKFKKQNLKIKGFLSSEIVVETKPENNWGSFIQQRLRWTSKSKYYKNPTIIFFGINTVIINAALLFIYVELPLVEKNRLILLFLLLTKWSIDFILLFLVASFFKRRSSLFYFIPVQMVYPIYVVIIWILSLTMKFEWKGRKYNG